MSEHTFESAKWVAEILNSYGYDAYIVGGAVRDMYLGRQPKDFDIATSATPERIKRMQEFAQSHYKDTAQAYGVTRVRFLHDDALVEVEVATFRKDIDAHKGRKQTKVAYTTLEDDVKRRDFTMNALAFDPMTGQIIDYVGGLDDLDAGLVRFIGEPSARIQEDPLRVMRAIRFKNQLGLHYADATAAAIRQAVASGVVEQIAVDRLRDELTRLLLHESRRAAFVDLDMFGIVERVLPEVAAGKGVAQPSEFHAEGDVWQHELQILAELPAHPGRRLAWAALLHDIGKPPTYHRAAGSRGVIQFHRHYAVGAELAKTVLRRLQFSNRDIKDIYWMIYEHMAIDDLPQMRPSHQQRMLGHRAFADLLELHKADAAASWRPARKGEHPQFPELETLWQVYQSKSPELQQPSLKRDLGIDGHWLLRHFGDDPRLTGVMIQHVLADFDDLYRSEGVQDEAAYVAAARRLLDELGETL